MTSKMTHREMVIGDIIEPPSRKHAVRYSPKGFAQYGLWLAIWYSRASRP